MSDLDTIRRYLASVRRSVLARECAASAVAVTACVVGLAVASSPAANPVVALAGRYACSALIAYAAVRVAVCLLRPPSLMAIAVRLEGELPGYRESLVTALEGGRLAEASASYAVAVAAGLARSPRPGATCGRMARVLTVGAALVVAAVLLLARTVSVPDAEPHGIPSEPPPVADRLRAAVEVVAARPPARAGADREPLVRVVVPQARQSFARSPSRTLDVTGVLLDAPPGFERAAELYLRSEPPAAPLLDEP
jgi:hypothetical protein